MGPQTEDSARAAAAETDASDASGSTANVEPGASEAEPGASEAEPEASEAEPGASEARSECEFLTHFTIQFADASCGNILWEPVGHPCPLAAANIIAAL